jgi:post-segregation antitoxin (ccd killing protein)
LNIRDIGDARRAALDTEAKARGVSVSELVRRFLDEGIERARSDRAREEWLIAAREGLAFEAEELGRRGPSLARYRRLPGEAG